ncbi:MAG: MSMEG_0565 family glycosyltransferase [Anaerolineae bacterium]|nr:MSMEG_0565 family glycosyltransferase [Gloeobacterales cyanobacterium ES-bin-313]
MSLSIALLTYSTKLRGGVVHTIELAEALHALGQRVCILALNKENSGFARLPACDYRLVPTEIVQGGTDQLIAQRIQEFVQYLSNSDERYDIYHAQDCIGANALSTLRQARKVPHFLRTVHHIDDFTSPYLQECQERSIREPDRCFVVSTQWQEALQRDYSIQALRVINGVKAERFSPFNDGSEAALKKRLGLIGGPIFLTVGGVEPRKNSIILLQAFSLVLAIYPQAQLVIAGGETLFDYNTYGDQFMAEAETLGIIPGPGKSLVLTGVIPEPNLPALYRCADAFVFPSLKEGWGLVVLEAIASGLSIVTSDQPPFTEFLDAEQAFLIDPKDPFILAQGMIQALQPAAKQRIQKSQAVLSTYTWKQSAKMHLNHYRQFLGEVHA